MNSDSLVRMRSPGCTYMDTLYSNILYDYDDRYYSLLLLLLRTITVVIVMML